ncbi:MAG: universal stress protein [Thermodesulfobacteriota bacterium]
MYQKIMVPLDGSELAECVLPHVETFISGCQVSSLVFVRVIESTPVTYRGTYVTSKEDLEKIEINTKKIEEHRKSNAVEYLERVVSQLKREGVKCQTEVLSGKVAESLVDYVEANGVDLIIIATHGRSGVSRWVRGSIADRILRASRVPVLMVRAPGTPSESSA